MQSRMTNADVRLQGGGMAAADDALCLADHLDTQGSGRASEETQGKGRGKV